MSVLTQKCVKMHKIICSCEAVSVAITLFCGHYFAHSGHVTLNLINL